MSVVPWMRARPSGKRVKVWGPRLKRRRRSLERRSWMSVWGREAVAHGGEVDGAMVLVDLDGVAAAEGDVGAAFAGEVSEDALAAGRCRLVGFGGADFAALV